MRRAVRRLLRHRRLPGTRGYRDPYRGAHDRGHAAAHPVEPAGSGGGARRAEVEDDRADLLSRGEGWHRHRRSAGHCPHRRRDGATAVHQPGQPELVGQPDAADGQPAGHHLPICRFGVRGLGATCLGRRAADHGRCAGHQYCWHGLHCAAGDDSEHDYERNSGISKAASAAFRRAQPAPTSTSHASRYAIWTSSMAPIVR